EFEPGALSAALGSGVADLARMIPKLRERLSITSQLAGDPQEDRWRLFQAATDLLPAAAAQRPLLLVLEDPHDADRGTLELLLHVARNVQGARLLVLGTYRDVDVDRAHPFSGVVTELQRARNFQRIRLHGLSEHQVRQLLMETSRERVPQAFAELVH